MKKWIFGAFIAACLATSPACKNKNSHKPDEKNALPVAEVPEMVKSAFNAKYPGASEVFWEDAHEGDFPTFKVKFKQQEKYWKAEFKADGSLVKEKED